MFRSMNFAVFSCLVLLPLLIMAQPPRTTPNPGPVEELSIQPGDLPGSVVFSWEAPEKIGICDIEAYSVQVRTVVADGQEPTEIVPPSLVLAEPTSVPITNLPPCILLEFNINALNCAGLGPQTTVEGAAPGPECLPTDPVTPIAPPERPELEVGEAAEEDEDGVLELPEVEAPAVEEVLDEPAEAPQEISELELDDDVEADEPDEADDGIVCTNVAPEGEFTCADQNAFGKCTADFIVAGGFCDRECGRCPGVCADVVPPDAETCANRLAWGNCDEEWMVNGGFCEVTCGRCPELDAVAGK